ncbi:MAG: DUF2336 domain-containing protein [Methylovirgula sp.]
MIVRRFMHWARTAGAAQRAEAAAALARVYLITELDPAEREEAELALTGLLDDASPLVRRALAEVFASAPNAPHHLVLGLADDQSDISSIVLGRSPVLSDSDLIDCAAIGDAIAQSAIALRPAVSLAVAAALAEVGAREALISLAINPGAEVPEFSLRRMVERFGADAEMREALLMRPGLPAALRADLVAAMADVLRAFVIAREWMSGERAQRVTRDACEQARVIIAATSEEGENGAVALIAHLRGCGQLTASLLLRALLSGNASLLEAALTELSGLPALRVKGLTRDWRGSGFAALYRRAGLPEALLPAFRAAIEALSSGDAGDASGASLSRQRVERVLTACKAENTGELDSLLAVLRRFAAEAARDEARQFSAALPAKEEGVERLVASAETPALLAPEEPPLRLSDEDVAEVAAAGITIDLAAIEAELAAA